MLPHQTSAGAHSTSLPDSQTSALATTLGLVCGNPTDLAPTLPTSHSPSGSPWSPAEVAIITYRGAAAVWNSLVSNGVDAANATDQATEVDVAVALRIVTACGATTDQMVKTATLARSLAERTSDFVPAQTTPRLDPAVRVLSPLMKGALHAAALAREMVKKVRQTNGDTLARAELTAGVVGADVAILFANNGGASRSERTGIMVLAQPTREAGKKSLTSHMAQLQEVEKSLKALNAHPEDALDTAPLEKTRLSEE